MNAGMQGCMNECFPFKHSATSNTAKVKTIQAKYFNKKYLFPTCLTARQVGILVVCRFLSYKDSTRQGGLQKKSRLPNGRQVGI
jgi:hypothetical protein